MSNHFEENKIMKSSQVSTNSLSYSSKNIIKCIQKLQQNNHYILIIAIHSIKLLSFIHLVLTYLLIEDESFAKTTQTFVNNIYSISNIYRILQVMIYISKAVQLVSIFAVFWSQNQGITLKIGIKIVKYISIISETDILLTSIFLLINLQENIVGFIISAAINIFVNIFIENYINRKAESYISSQIGSIVYKLIQISIFFSNSIVVFVGNPLYFYIFNFITAIVVLKWYKDLGINLHIHSKSKNITMLSVSIYFTLIIIILQRFFRRTDIFALINIIKFLTVFGCIYFSWFFMQKRSNRNFVQISNFSQKIIDLKTFAILNISVYSEDVTSLLIGLFRIHHNGGCSNPKCYTHNELYYDCTLKQKISIIEDLKERQSILRFHIKCLYESALQKAQGLKLQLLFDCCEFLLNESFDFYQLSRLIHDIELFHLNIFERVRLERIKFAVRDECFRLNRLVFEGRMEIEKMIAAEDTFFFICNNIDDYLLKNYDIWMEIEREEVNLTHLKTKITSALAILNDINALWGKIAAYLPLQRRWKFLYTNYVLFILNQRIKQKDIEDLEIMTLDDPSINDKYLDEQSKAQKLFDRTLLFDQNAMYLHTVIQNGSLILLKTSRNFQNQTGYGQEQLKGVELKEILSNDIKEDHDKKVISWLQAGQSNNEAQYKVCFTEVKIKSGIMIPVVKYFKILINIQAQKENFLQFVCLLKKNMKDHNPANKAQIDQEKSCRITSNLVNDQFVQKQGNNVTKVQNNPFIKEQNLKPKESMQGLTYIKRAIRLLILFLILMNGSLSLLTSFDCDTLIQYVNQYMNLLNLYRYPFNFGKSVIKVGMKIGNQVKATNQMIYSISQIELDITDDLTTKAIFSPKINPANTYFPFQADSINKNIGYNEVDLIYFMVSNMETLKISPINLTSQSFLNFNAYLAPSYNNLLNTTKASFHNQFNTFFHTMSQSQLIIVYVEIVICIIATIYVGYTLREYFRKMRGSLEIIVEFSEIQVKKILNYWKNLMQLCQEISGIEIDKAVGISNISSIMRISNGISASQQNDDTTQPKISLNKKNKRIHQKKSQKRRVGKLILITILCMLVCLGSSVVVQLISVSNLNLLDSFQEAGFFFIRYFPSTSILSYAVQEKYYFQVTPKLPPFNFARYQQSLSDISIIGSSSYIGNVAFPNSQYYQYEKIYLFGNPCLANQLPLNGTDQTVAKCLSIYNSTFSQGISTFLRACRPQVEDFLGGKINLTSTQANELANGFNLASAYITDAINTWANEFSVMIKDFNDRNTLLCVLVSVCLLVVYAVLGECMLLPQLTKDYAFMRKVFEHMVPESILIDEKVIKQKFVINEMLDNQ